MRYGSFGNTFCFLLIQENLTPTIHQNLSETFVLWRQKCSESTPFTFFVTKIEDEFDEKVITYAYYVVRRLHIGVVTFCHLISVGIG